MKLKVEKDFTPCPEADGDELYPNGIFLFNITKKAAAPPQFRISTSSGIFI
jgi:hypothetical protein